MRTDGLHVALFQSELHWEAIDKNISQFSNWLQSLEDVDLVVLPEMFSTGFTMNPSTVAESMDGKAVSFLRNAAITKGVTILGSFVCSQDGRFTNRLVVVKPDGVLQSYDKRHLFRMAGEDEVYTPGNERLIVNVKGWNICPLVCYDLRFPVWSRNTNSLEIDAYIYVANWPAVRVSAWDALLKARAIENLSYTIGVNRVGTDGNEVSYCGHSNAYDFKGEALIHPMPEDTGVFRIYLSKEELSAYRQKFPANRDADQFRLS